ncbi:MAG: ABC-F family ATP-binding cassette domain-containing protein [Verrucomicrobia bacterium]|nr:ABC-F family ATP-binding cassette domain-containing protein [Verrucomicrobiota bacterium]
MFTLSEVSKSYGGRALFEDVTIQINRDDRLGLVGPNGAGKSTLFKLILGQEECDHGIITSMRGATVGFLPQESAPVGEETVLELATAISPEFVEVRRKLKEWDAAHPDDVDPHDNLHARYDEMGGWQLDAKAKKILAGLDFRESDFHRPARELSGGWVMRAHLARLLVQEPDLLMLDEPTNHLDLETLLWFQEYLFAYPGGIVLISHDREFLNTLVTGIIELRQQKLFSYTGNYDNFLEQRAAAEAQQLAAHKNQQRDIARLQEFADRFGAKASKASQAQSKLKQIERMVKIEAPESSGPVVGFSFPQPVRSGQRALKLAGLHHAYGDNVVYRGVDFEVERGQRVVLVGPNGAGKSTLLKLASGTLPVQRGERILGHNVKEGYYAQYRSEMFQMNRTVLAEALDTVARVTEQSVRTLLGAFLFRGDDVFKKVSVLSGGEKSRLALVKILLDPPNLLLMDEPTTHLDMASIDALVGALKNFTGTLIFISHDVYFIRALANRVLHVNAGALTNYPGDYQYYLDKTKAASARLGLTAGEKAVVSSSRTVAPEPREPGLSRKEQKRLEAQQRQARSAGERDARRRVAELEKRIADCEAKQSEYAQELENPATYEKAGAAMHLNRELSVVVDELTRLQAEWEEAATKLAAEEAASKTAG